MNESALLTEFSSSQESVDTKVEGDSVFNQGGVVLYNSPLTINFVSPKEGLQKEKSIDKKDFDIFKEQSKDTKPAAVEDSKEKKEGLKEESAPSKSENQEPSTPEQKSFEEIPKSFMNSELSGFRVVAISESALSEIYSIYVLKNLYREIGDKITEISSKDDPENREEREIILAILNSKANLVADRISKVEEVIKNRSDSEERNPVKTLSLINPALTVEGLRYMSIEDRSKVLDAIGLEITKLDVSDNRYFLSPYKAELASFAKKLEKSIDD
ncbi:MAG: hypothetical protein SFT81_04470 [Candidatus Caenarcaniphilales bacterium]|nr:hypothetical protein [Candidatus Caenarcaniphilales bacterium]